eukprot:m51a1_g11205 putative acyl- -binding domain-containing protein 4-like (386) ;mRNA; r:28742-29899
MGRQRQRQQQQLALAVLWATAVAVLVGKAAGEAWVTVCESYAEPEGGGQQNRTQRAGTCLPPPRWLHTLTLTPAGYLLFGGQSPGPSAWPRSDLWLHPLGPRAPGSPAWLLLQPDWREAAPAPLWAALPDPCALGRPGPAPRWGHSAAVEPDGSLLVVGGSCGPAEVWRYDLARSRTWALLSDPAAGGPALAGSAAALVGNSDLLLFGGARGGAPTDDLWRFSTATRAWSRLQRPADAAAPWPPRRANHSAASNGTHLVVFGGEDGAGAALADTWLYDAGRGRWAQGPAGPNARALHASAVCGDGTVVVSHGVRRASGVFFSDVWGLDRAGTAWRCLSGGAATDLARTGTATACSPRSDAVLMAGGRSGPAALQSDLRSYTITNR